MPKRVGYIYGKMEDADFIDRCIAIGTKDSKKRRRNDVKRVLDNREGHIKKMQQIVRERSFTPKLPNRKKVYDQSSLKVRDTSSVPFFPDGLLHIMEAQAMMDVLMRGMDPWSCASIPNRGTIRVYKRIRHAMQDRPKQSVYAGEMDIEGYYNHINLRILFESLERKIKDKEFLLLLAITVRCEQISLCDALALGLTWRDIVGDAIGLLIGLYINQWLANFNLEPVDRAIQKMPDVKFHTRHMDNIVIFGPNKKKLHAARKEIESIMRSLGLTMKADWQIFRTTFTRKAMARRMLMTDRQRYLRRPRRISAAGYQFGHRYTTMRRRNFLRFARQCRRVQKRTASGNIIAFSQASGLLSRIGQLSHCNGYNARVKYVDPIGVKTLKEVVRYESKRRSRSQRSILAGGAA